MIAEKYSIPLMIILINNNGGGIFNSLPVSRHIPIFLKEYFITPHKLNFEKLTKAFGVNYSKLRNGQILRN